MNNAAVQRKLDEVSRLCNELNAEAVSRYGSDGHLFFESGGTFHIMSGDAHPDREGMAERLEYVKFSSEGYCSMGAGAW